MSIIINAQNLIVGRMAAFAAKKAMMGEKIDIINCEKAVITGQKKQILAHYQQKRRRGGPKQGPFMPRMPDRFVRRIIRGMLPYKKPRGKDAFKNVMCWVGVPEQFKDKKSVTIKSADASCKTVNYVKISELCKLLGAKNIQK
jgi:large subunit ribosomal protein L13